ncbi:MAG: hypothetical protein H7301_08095 [Cryobacterium sp.]|nr:hypothetical protein [Oligoflexia bacterium]
MNLHSKLLNAVVAALLATLCTSTTTFAEEKAPTEKVVKKKYGPTATRLFDAHEYVRKNAAPDYWALSPYYDPQMNGAACSLASVTMVVNAARASMPLTASDELATQPNLLKKVNSSVWNEGVAKGTTGVDLDQLGVLVGQSLKAYGLEPLKIEVVHVDSTTDAMMKKVRSVLEQNEKNASDFVIANFQQSDYTGDPEGAIGHIAPVAAYDRKAKKVLVMDVDRQYYEPYWVSEETFLKGMATKDSGGKNFRGFVYVTLKK